MIKRLLVLALSSASVLAQEPPVVAPAVRVPLVHEARFAVADANLDGLQDVIGCGFDLGTQVIRVVCTPGIGGGRLGAPISSPGSSLFFFGLHLLAVADLDEDQLPEAITQSTQQDAVSLWRGVGDGSFQSPVDITAVPGAVINTAVVLDANMDGHLDVAISTGSLGGGETVTLLLGAGDGTLTPSASVPSTLGFAWLAGGDLDLDGDTDLAVLTSPTTHLLQVIKVGGPSLLTALPAVAAPFGAVDLDIGQVTGSMHPDIVIASAIAGSANTVVRNFGGNTFVPLPSIADDDGWGRVKLADVGGDGLLDLVGLAASSVSSLTGDIRVRRGQVSGSFDPAQVLPLVEPSDLVVADMDADGLADAVVAAQAWDSRDILVLRGQSPDRFVWHELIPSIAEVTDLVPADFNADGLPDVLVTSTKDEGLVGVQLGDGQGGLGPVLAAAVSAGEPVAAAAVDIEGDGDQDVAVLLNGPEHTVIHRNLGAGAPALGQDIAAGQSDVASGDLDLDGLPDLLLSRGSNGPTAGLYEADNQGLGLFGAPYLAGQANEGGSFVGIGRIALADFNSDGALDVVGTSASGNLQAFENTIHAFTPNHALDGTNLIGAFGVGDFNEDGLMDVAANSYAAGYHVTVALGDGAWHFFPWSSSEELEGIGAPLLVEDQDGDGHLDILVHDANASVQLLRGDGDGQIHTAWRTAASRVIGALALVDLDGSGRAEALAGPSFTGIEMTRIHEADPLTWTILPAGKPGDAGVPLLQGTGTLLAGSPLTLSLSKAAPSAPVTLVLGLSQIDQPFKGGLLVPSPDLLLPGLASNGAGQLVLPATWPSGLPSGLSLWFQAWITDASATHGLAASTGLQALTP